MGELAAGIVPENNSWVGFHLLSVSGDSISTLPGWLSDLLSVTGMIMVTLPNWLSDFLSAAGIIAMLPDWLSITMEELAAGIVPESSSWVGFQLQLCQAGSHSCL